MSQKLHIYAVSDSVGETAEKIAIASVLQFDVERNVTRFSRVNKEEQVKNIVSQAVKEDAIIVYTIVKPKLSKYMESYAAEQGIIAVNVMDPLLKAIERKKDNLMITVRESTDELSMYDQHPADVASDLYEREKDAGLLEMMELELQKVNDALNRYQNGQYGICSICGRAIEPERLDRLVYTTQCIQCARQTKDNFTRPAEEDISFSGAMSDRGESFEIAGYDFYDPEN